MTFLYLVDHVAFNVFLPEAFWLQNVTYNVIQIHTLTTADHAPPPQYSISIHCIVVIIIYEEQNNMLRSAVSWQ